MKTAMILLLLFLVFPLSGIADTIREAVAFTPAEIEAIPEKLWSRKTAISQTQKDLIAETLKQGESVAPKEVLQSLTEQGLDGVSVVNLTLVLGDLPLANEFRNHMQPEIRFMANYYLAKSGQLGAAVRLRTLIDDDTLSELDARYLKTRFASIGIDVQKDSAADIGKYLAQIDREFPVVALGGDIPDLGFTDSTGRHVSLKEFRGKTVILHYWATWCIPCMEEIDSLVKRLETLDRDDYVVIFVSLDFDQKSHSKAIEMLPKRFRFACDGRSGRSLIASTFAVSHIPANVIISPEGQLASVNISELFPKDTPPSVAQSKNEENGTKQ